MTSYSSTNVPYNKFIHVLLLSFTVFFILKEAIS